MPQAGKSGKSGKSGKVVSGLSPESPLPYRGTDSGRTEPHDESGRVSGLNNMTFAAISRRWDQADAERLAADRARAAT
jgi:hypothetical protein